MANSLKNNIPHPHGFARFFGPLSMTVLLLAGLNGCATGPAGGVRLPDDALNIFFAKAQDPRRLWLTVYESDNGPVFSGANRLSPGRVARSAFVSAGNDESAPVIAMDAKNRNGFPVLVDTSSTFSWMDLALSLQLENIALGPPAFKQVPTHVTDPVVGYAGATARVMLDRVSIDTAIFYTRAAPIPMEALGRKVYRPRPLAVLGCDLLGLFQFVQLDYPGRVATFSTSIPYTMDTNNLMTTLALKIIDGAFAVNGVIEGKSTTLILDTAGDFELAVTDGTTEPIRQIILGDLVLRQVTPVSCAEMDCPAEHPRLGRRLLGKFKVTLEPKKNLVHFERPAQSR